MSRPSLEQLSAEQQNTAWRIPLGSYWRHQSSGKVYEITGITLDEATNEARIGYRPVVINNDPYSAGSILPVISPLDHSRVAREWCDHVTWHDGENSRNGPRFKRVWPKTVWADA